MNQMNREYLKIYKEAHTIQPLTKGFSTDEKYVIDQNYLLRIFPKEELVRRKIEFETISKLTSFSKKIPRPIEFGELIDEEKGYMVLSYIPGADGEENLTRLNESEQYRAGVKAAEELKKLHQLNAPLELPEWHIAKKNKSDNYLKELKLINLDEHTKDRLTNYIRENEPLMQGRPNQFQHDDFHPSNLVFHHDQFSGIIDFQRMDWGDPIHDLQKIGFFTKQVSPAFAKGNIDGYLRDKREEDRFWPLYGLYSAMHIVSAFVWGMKMGPKQFEFLSGRAFEVLEDHDYFQSNIPKWYR